MSNRFRNVQSMFITILCVTLISGYLQAQNRGNNLAFQGFGNIAESSATALGMGGAFSSISGRVDALNYNSAGLAGISKLQISIGGGSVSRQWTENQIYNPNRLFFTLPFYLERLYIPDPANNGKRDNEVFFDGLTDSSYVVARPDTGLESYSDEAADWKKTEKATGLTNFSFAYPFKIAGKNIVVAASWNKKLDFYDYDRNESYLDPHPGYTEYDMPERVDGSDSVEIFWSDFERQRSGSLQEFRGALALDLTEIVKIGFSVNYFTGETEDGQILDRIGWFHLYDENRFAFSYDTFTVSTSGTSNFSGLKTELGVQLVYDAFSIGLNLKLPYTVTRQNDYTLSTIDTASVNTKSLKSTEKFKVPFAYTIGVNFRPTEKFMFSMDYNLNMYSNAEWEIANGDTTHRDWVDQKILKFGLQYTPVKFLSLRAGYRSIPQVFVPDGATFRDRGPEARAWTLGAGLNFGQYGALNVAWEYRLLKYYDQYFSNTNYCKEITQNILIAYQYNF